MPGTTSGRSLPHWRIWNPIRHAVLVRDQWRCYQCGGKADTVDHIVARINGGSDHMANLKAMCRKCNGRKGRGSITAPITSRQW